MAQPKKVDRLPDALRADLTARIKAGGFGGYEALSDWLADQGYSIGKSALAEHGQALKEIIRHERDMQVAAEALVAELGEDFDDKSGALLVQAVTTLASRTAMGRLRSGEEMEIGDVLDLTRAAKTAQEARSLNLRERQAVAKAAREKLLAEQKEKLDGLKGAAGIDLATARRISQEVYGVAL